ncbi:MAG: lipoprotein 17-related variable surface protein [Malacoplasma sp.]
MKIAKKLKISLMSLCSLCLMAMPIYLINSVNNTNKHQIANNSLATTKMNSSVKNYDHENRSLETISNKLGPIVVKEKSIVNYDWYYNDYWTVDLTKYSNSTTISDWEFLQDKDLLFVITDKAHLIKINTETGEVLANTSSTDSGIPTSTNKIGFISYDLELYAWNSYTQNGQVYALDRNILKVIPTTPTITQGAGLSILNSLRLDIGYNLAITTTSSLNSPTSTITNLGIYFYTDNFQKFTPTTSSGSIASVTSTITATKYTSIYSNLFYRESSQTYVLIINNKFYEINLNKQDMEKTTITEFNNASAPNTNVTFTNINSAFITAGDMIYIKSDSDSKIYSIKPNAKTIDLFIDLALTTNNTEISTIAKDTSNKLQIYGVVSVDTSSKSTRFLEHAIFLSDPMSIIVGGVVNGAVAEKFSDTKPNITIKNSATFYNSIPSSVTSNSFEAKNSDPLLGSNVFLESDDIKGELVLKAILTKNVWYEERSNLKTTTIYNKVYKLIASPTKFVFANQTTFSSISSGYFNNRTPSQIDESDFNTFVNQILPTGAAPSGTFNNITKLFIITGRDDVAGTIKVKAIVSYENRYNNIISFIVPEVTYNVKKSGGASYLFEFVADDSPVISDFKKFLPSLIDTTNKIELEKFIKTENSYIPSRRVLTLQPDDVAGTLKVSVYYNGLDPAIPSTFSFTFTGFVTEQSAKILFNGDVVTNPDPRLSPETKNITTISGYGKYGDKLSSDIKISDLTLTYNIISLANMNFSPLITIQPISSVESELGALTLELDFSKQPPSSTGKILPSIYKDKFGLNNYKITQQYLGFLPIGATYGLGILSYRSEPIQNLFKTFPVGSDIPISDIKSTLDLKGFEPTDITVNGYNWVGEKLEYSVTAHSKKYTSIKNTNTFQVDWSLFFAEERTKNLIIGVTVAVIGTVIIAGAIVFYILRKNKIRRLLK